MTGVFLTIGSNSFAIEDDLISIPVRHLTGEGATAGHAEL